MPETESNLPHEQHEEGIGSTSTAAVCPRALVSASVPNPRTEIQVSEMTFAYFTCAYM